MELGILNKESNPVLKRTKIEFEVQQGKDAVPPRVKVHDKLAIELGEDKSLVVVRKIEPYFGSSNARGEAVLYDSKEALERVEPDYTRERLQRKKEEEEGSEKKESNKGDETKGSEED